MTGALRALCAPLWLWTALSVPIAAVAQSGVPALPLAVPPLAIQGPSDSTIRLEIANRIRGEFVDWFATPPNGPNPTTATTSSATSCSSACG
jgi:hypothetical protein